MDSLMNLICMKYKIKFFDVSKLEPSKRLDHDYQRNCGWSSHREICLGEFDDPECRIISFFHELGHNRHYQLIPVERNSKIKYFKGYGHLGNEVFSWRYAIKFLKRMNIQLSKSAYNWATTQLLTYASDRHVKEYGEYNTCPFKISELAINLSLLSL